MEHNIEIHPSIISSKGQITIPKEVREHMKLQTGDVLSFKINKENNTISLEKGVIECKLCKGAKTIGDKICPVCEGKGTLEVSKSLFQYFEILVKSEIYVSLIHEDIIGEKRLKRKIPLVKVTSTVYPKEFLDYLQDHLQFIAINEFCKDIKIGIEKADNIVTIEEIVDCLTVEENKQRFSTETKNELEKIANPFKKIYDTFFGED